MTAKQYLEQYKEACRIVRRYQNEYDEESIMIDAIRSLSDNDGMPHGSGISKPTEDKAVRLSEKKQQLITAIQDAVGIRQEVFNTIMLIGGLESEVLVERFINLQTWEGVCESVHYSWFVVRKAWHRGEDMIQELIDKSNKNIQV